MLTVAEAWRELLRYVRRTGTERVELTSALGRVLAEDVCADRDFPPFDRALMDGYALRAADLPAKLKVVGTVAAGDNGSYEVKSGEAFSIMTGARLPLGADLVVMLEDCVKKKEGVVDIAAKATRWEHISLKGSQNRSGDLLLPAGFRLSKAAHIGLLAQVGCHQPLVTQFPKVGILATGSEIGEPGDPLTSEVMIRNSNGYQLISQLKMIGLTPHYYGIVPDDFSVMCEKFSLAAQENDLLLFTGGVSRGEFDFVPKVLAKLGFEVIFDRLAMRPGRPTTFAASPTTCCFGLPGHPLSALVACELLVKPYIFAMMGVLPQELPEALHAPLQFLPYRMSAHGTIELLACNGSSHLSSVAAADGMVSGSYFLKFPRWAESN